MCLKAITTTNQRRGKYLWELMRSNQTNCQKRGKRRATKSWLISVLLLIGRAGGASFQGQSQSELKKNRYDFFWNVLDDKLFSSFTDQLRKQTVWFPKKSCTYATLGLSSSKCHFIQIPLERNLPRSRFLGVTLSPLERVAWRDQTTAEKETN